MCGHDSCGSDDESDILPTWSEVQKTATGCCWSFKEDKGLDLFVKSCCDEHEGVEYSEGTLSNLEKNVWESLPQPIIIDRGASTSVLPLKWCTHERTAE